MIDLLKKNLSTGMVMGEESDDDVSGSTVKYKQK